MKAMIIVGLVFLASLAGCHHPSRSQTSLLGIFDLKAYDKSGRKAFTGIIDLTAVNPIGFKGRCTIVREKDASEGVFDQNAPCDATLQGKKVNIDLAPDMDDGGMLMEGEFDGARITGVWMFDSFAGTQIMGRFEAVRNH